MSDDDQQTFNIGGDIPAESVAVQAGSIKNGDYYIIKGFPCKVTECTLAKTGKHGSAKVSIVASDIFTNVIRRDIISPSAIVHLPNVTKEELEVTGIEDNKDVTYIKSNGEVASQELPVDDKETYNELLKVWKGKSQTETVFFTLMSACGKSKFISARIQ